MWVYLTLVGLLPHPPPPPPPPAPLWQSIPVCQSKTGSPGIILGLPNPPAPQWQSIPERRSNTGSPGILCHMVLGGRESQDNPATLCHRGAGGFGSPRIIPRLPVYITPAFWDTLPQGCWGVRESQDNPGTAGVTPAFWDTLPQGCWGVRESKDNPGTAAPSVTWDRAMGRDWTWHHWTFLNKTTGPLLQFFEWAWEWG